jgi:hypothetical protein
VATSTGRKFSDLGRDFHLGDSIIRRIPKVGLQKTEIRPAGGFHFGNCPIRANFFKTYLSIYLLIDNAVPLPSWSPMARRRVNPNREVVEKREAEAKSCNEAFRS